MWESSGDVWEKHVHQGDETILQKKNGTCVYTPYYTVDMCVGCAADVNVMATQIWSVRIEHSRQSVQECECVCVSAYVCVCVCVCV